MKEFVTVAVLKGKPGEPEKRELLAGPEVPYHVQRENYRKLTAKSESDRFESVTLYEMAATRRFRFNRPKPVMPEAPKAPEAQKAEGGKPAKAEKPKAPKAPKAQPQQSAESKNENA